MKCKKTNEHAKQKQTQRCRERSDGFQTGEGLRGWGRGGRTKYGAAVTETRAVPSSEARTVRLIAAATSQGASTSDRHSLHLELYNVVCPP